MPPQGITEETMMYRPHPHLIALGYLPLVEAAELLGLPQRTLRDQIHRGDWGTGLIWGKQLYLGKAECLQHLEKIAYLKKSLTE
jgi:hypothetical protein